MQKHITVVPPVTSVNSACQSIPVAPRFRLRRRAVPILPAPQADAMRVFRLKMSLADLVEGV